MLLCKSTLKWETCGKHRTSALSQKGLGQFNTAQWTYLKNIKQHYASIQKYIDYPSDYPLKNQYSENTDIDNPNEPKPLPKENKRIDKAITKLKLER